MATETRWETFLDRVARTALFYSPLRHFVLYKYRYAFSPSQLRALLNLVDEALAVPGDLVEVGCYRGYTTTFLNRHLNEVAPGRRYLAIDTFSGFTPESVDVEVKQRGKSAGHRAFAKFTVNSRRVFDATLKLNNITRVAVIEGDICRRDLDPAQRFCFGLIDVDLYAPSRAGLEKVWAQLNPGGVIVVDDCQPRQIYDGSRQALEEFGKEHGVAFEIVAEKLGVLRKPR
ncbi:MAG: TylF/MycF family methyltransferase [Opitutus sp.]|nr:TylF/MycF family methyltransferase [Opitutus sp.]